MLHVGNLWHLYDVFQRKITEISSKHKQESFYILKYNYIWIFSWLIKLCNKICSYKMRMSLQLVKTQEIATYLRFEAYWRQNCINETWNSVYRMFHTSVSWKVTCSYLFEAICKPILFIIIDINTYFISTCCYAWYLSYSNCPFSCINHKSHLELMLPNVVYDC